MKDKIYISGGMSDVPREHYLARFALAEKLLRGAGYSRIVNPTRFWVCRFPWLYRTIERLLGKDRAYVAVLLYDLWQLSRCTRIYKIPTWKQSRGANIESCLAYHLKIWPPSKKVTDHCDKQIEKMIVRQENETTN